MKYYGDIQYKPSKVDQFVRWVWTNHGEKGYEIRAETYDIEVCLKWATYTKYDVNNGRRWFPTGIVISSVGGFTTYFVPGDCSADNGPKIDMNNLADVVKWGKLIVEGAEMVEKLLRADANPLIREDRMVYR